MNRALQGKKILIVDDEEDLRDVLSSRIEMEGSEVVLAENGKLAVNELKKHTFDAVISDIRMPGIDGIGLLNLIRAVKPTPAVVLISGFTDVAPDEVIARGASALLIKPFDLDDMIRAIQNALSPHHSA
jgi:DNA-binding NtrC family response regulator